jgi:hypothetical protein
MVAEDARDVVRRLMRAPRAIDDLDLVPRSSRLSSVERTASGSELIRPGDPTWRGHAAPRLEPADRGRGTRHGGDRRPSARGGATA